MTIKHNFTIAMPNQPYVDDFSEGKTQAATYTGAKYIKVQYDLADGTVRNILNEADTLEELNARPVGIMEGHAPLEIDATVHPKIAAYLSGNYDTGPVEDYSEDLGTTDADGNAETWTYYWNDNKGVLSQIYLRDTIKWVDNNFVGPEFRAHAVSEENFKSSVANRITQDTAELARDGVYTDEEKAEIQNHKAFLESIETKYAGIKHWKLVFPSSPSYK